MEGLSLKDCFELFILNREGFCSLTTIDNYKRNLSYFLNFMSMELNRSTDSIQINAVTKLDIDKFILYLRNKPKFENHPFKVESDEKLTKRSIRTYSIDLNTFFHFLYENEYIENDIVKNFHIIRSEKKVINVLSQSDVDCVDKTFNVKTFLGLRNKIIFHLMLDCGFRVSDVINLNVSDCDYERKIIIVRNGKGDKDRIVPFPLNLRKMIKEYITFYKKYDSNLPNLLYCTGDDGIYPLTKNAIKMFFQRLKNTSEIDRIYAHLCRHTFATSYILSGGDVSSLRVLLGHSSITTTENYLHLAQQYKASKSSYYQLDRIYFERIC